MPTYEIVCWRAIHEISQYVLDPLVAKLATILQRREEAIFGHFCHEIVDPLLYAAKYCLAQMFIPMKSGQQINISQIRVCHKPLPLLFCALWKMHPERRAREKSEF